MNDNYIINETRDIYSSLEPLESLCFVYHLLDLIVNGLTYEIETAKDQKEYNSLNTCLLTIKEILESNEVQ